MQSIEKKETCFISAVVYVHNSEKNVLAFLEKLNAFLANAFQKYEIICVNDKSDDHSTEMVTAFSKKIENATMTLLQMSFTQGLEAAMNAGVDLSIGDFVYEFDSTLPMITDDMMREVYDRCLQGYDIVSASPKRSGHKLSAVFYSIYNRYSDSQYALRTEVFRILSRRAINRVQSMSRTIPYRKAIYGSSKNVG